ncbi:MAG: TetR/AcrR family transcriptional regulator [Desulfobacterales bacterium]|nr:TetR/AcrR family transcriptional regulator [Desulfobacterales bacterium]
MDKMNRYSRLTRSEQKQATREKLIQSTYDVIASEGFSGVTLAKVSRLAGFSMGICNFHFENKEKLLHETLRFHYQEFEASWKKGIDDTSAEPIEKLIAVIETSLTPPYVAYRKLAVWFAFSSESLTRETFLELTQTHDLKWENNIESILREIVDENFVSYGMSLRQITISLISLIAGFWVDFYLYPDRTDSGEAVSTCLIFLSKFFPVIETKIKKE